MRGRAVRGSWPRSLAVVAAALVAFTGVIAGTHAAHASGAVVPGFDSIAYGPTDDGSYPCTSLGAGTPFGCGPSPLGLGFDVNFFGTVYSSVFLNNNGNLTFGAPLATFTPFPLSNAGPPIIAPFFGDVDTRAGNLVTFGTGLLGPYPVFAVHWPGVGCFSTNTSVLNDFQVILIDRFDIAPGDFDIEFNYDQVQWETGEASGGDAACQGGTAARVGYAGGSGATGTYFELPGSGQDGAFLDRNPTTGLIHDAFNSSQLGRYIFNFRNGSPLIASGAPGTATGLGDGWAAINNPTCSRALPVNCASGNFTHTFVDSSIPGPGPAIDLTRTYNSLSTSAGGLFGPGWSSAYDVHVTANPDGSATVTEQDGSQVTGVPVGGGVYAMPSWADSTLTRNADGTWAFVRHAAPTLTFAPGGQLASIADFNGYRTTLGYDGSQGLQSVTDAVGRSLAVAEGANGLVSSVTDPIGLVTRYSYDGAGNLASVTDPAGGVTFFGYDASHLLLTMTDPRGGTTTNVYDAAGRVVSQQSPLGRRTTFAYSGSAYSALGGTTTITAPNGGVEVQRYVSGELMSLTRGSGTSSQAIWTYGYDPGTLGRARITDPDGHTTASTFDGHGNLVSTNDPLGSTRSFTYDSVNDRTSATDALGVTTTYTYDSGGNVTSVSRPLLGTAQAHTVSLAHDNPARPSEVTAMVDANGHTITMAYDTAGNRVRVTDPDGDTTTYAYDGDGRMTSTVSPDGNVAGGNPAANTTSFAYDALGDMTSTTDPLGHVARAVYDAGRNLVRAVDADGNVTVNQYDADNELVATTRADGTVVRTGYDANGNVISQTDAAGAVTTYTYDPLNRAVSSTDPLGRTTSASYDGSGNRTSLVSASGVTTSYSYDAANRLTGLVFSDGVTPGVTFSYDADGRRDRMTDGTGTTSYTYDSLSRLTATTDGAGSTVGYGYDLNGQITSLTYPNGRTVSRAYDPAGRLVTVADWLGDTISFAYDASGNPIAAGYPNGVGTASVYNAANQLTGITHSRGSSTPASFTYDRDAGGQVVSATTTGISSGTEVYSYTALNQLSSLDRAPYAYDPAGNLVRTPLGTASYDAASQLTGTTAGAGTTSFSYDQLANRTLASGPGVEPRSCVLCVLEPSAGSALSTSGSGQVQSGGIVAVDSTSPSALSASGPSAVHATEVFVAGGAALSGSAAVTPSPVTGMAGVDDPLAALPAPVVTGAVQSVNTSGSLTASPGIYSSIAVSNAGFVTLNPGVYVVTGSVSVSGSATLAGTGVTLYLACPSYPVPCAPGQAGAALTASGGHVSLAVGAVGPGAGVAIFADRLSTGKISVQGSARLDVTGSVYAAQGQLSISGQAQAALSGGVAVVGTAPVSGGWLSVDMSGAVPAVAYAYDAANRLVSLRSPTTQASYSYDGDGLRMARTVDGTAAHFAWDRSGQAPLLLSDGAASYVYGPGGMPVEQISGSTATYLQQDQLGSTRLLTDSSGSVVGQYAYDPYGNVTRHTGAASTPLLFQGQYRDSESGLVYLRARFYDPATAQFLTRDPLAQLTRSPFAYAGGNPLTYADPTGEYHYDTSFDLGSTSNLGDPQAAISYLMAHAAQIFPFPLGSCSSLSIGGTCLLRPMAGVVACLPAGHGCIGYDPVQVVRVTACSFTFETLQGGVLGDWNTITFHTYSENGELYLQPVAFAPTAPGGVDTGAPLYAENVVWPAQAQNLANALRQIHP